MLRSAPCRALHSLYILKDGCANHGYFDRFGKYLTISVTCHRWYFLCLLVGHSVKRCSFLQGRRTFASWRSVLLHFFISFFSVFTSSQPRSTSRSAHVWPAFS